MSDAAIATARSAASAWKADAGRRRMVSAQDPVADTLEYCAGDLIEKLRPLDAPDAVQTVEQYAAAHDVSPQAVRKWIGNGRLDATMTAHGWRILRSARVRPSTRRPT
jgi:hypothetical protein